MLMGLSELAHSRSVSKFKVVVVFKVGHWKLFCHN